MPYKMISNNLSSYLEIGPSSFVSLVGAGGKTTTMFRLAHELSDKGLRVITTTTTAIQMPSKNQTPLVLTREEIEQKADYLSEALEKYRHVTIVGTIARKDKLLGVDFDFLQRVKDIADSVIAEADGARHKLIKAPAEHEPAVPPYTTHFVAIASLKALGMPLSEVCHRPEEGQKLACMDPSLPLTVEAFAKILASPLGILKGKPEGIRSYLLLTALSQDNKLEAEEIARRVVSTNRNGFDLIIGVDKEGGLVVL